MTLIRKTYLKWNPKFNGSKFYLRQKIQNDELKAELKLEEVKETIETYSLKSNPNISIKVENETIIQKSFKRGSEIEKLFEFNNLYMTKHEDELVRDLEKCDESFNGSKLTLCYMDLILVRVILSGK